MKVSIIIPTYNGLALTKKCLESLKKNTPELYLGDVVVVDNGSTDGTVEYLASLSRIKPIFNRKNLDFAKACNQGAKKAIGDIFVFLNNDTEVQKGWLEPLLETLREKNVAVVGSKMVFPNGLIQHAGIVISKKYIPQHIYWGKKANLPYVNKKREFQAVTAACMAVKKEVFKRVGGFDEGYINGLEDVDLCLKAKGLGYKVYYYPESVVVHHEGMSQDRFKEVGHNEKIFLEKWKDKIEPDEAKYYLEDGLGRFYSKKRIIKDKVRREVRKVKDARG